MPHLALEIVKNLPLGIYGNTDYSFSTHATLIDALSAYAPKQGSYSEAVRWELVVDGAFARIVQRPLFRFDAPNPVGVEIDNAFVVRRFRDVLGDAAVEVRAVRFTHAAPPETRLYDEFFGVRVEFGAEESDVAFPVLLFQEPLLTANPALAALLAEQEPPPALVRRDPFVLQARQAIGALLAEAPDSIGLGDVATRLGASSRSLQRRLSEQGVSFSELVDEERRELAKTLLSREGTLLCEVAYRLGFSGVSPFLRAFRRWTGTSAAEFRAKAIG
jgi:AraC-like DNA-binding protein